MIRSFTWFGGQAGQRAFECIECALELRAGHGMEQVAVVSGHLLAKNGEVLAPPGHFGTLRLGAGRPGQQHHEEQPNPQCPHLPHLLKHPRPRLHDGAACPGQPPPPQPAGSRLDVRRTAAV